MHPPVLKDFGIADCRWLVTVSIQIGETAEPRIISTRLRSPSQVRPTLESGHAANVIPERAEARGTIRTFFREDQQQVHSAMRAAVESTAAAFGCTGTVTVTPVEPPLVNDPGLADACLAWLKGAHFDPAPEFRSCGSDDFAFCYQIVVGEEAGVVQVGAAWPGAEEDHLARCCRLLPGASRSLTLDQVAAELRGNLGPVSMKSVPA